MKHLHSKPKVINIPWRLIVAILFILTLLATTAEANQPMCEIYNYDTDECETFAEQNITLEPKFKEFYIKG